MWLQAAGLGLSMLSGYNSAKAAEVQQRVQAANQYQQTLINHERELKGIQQALVQQQQRNSAIAKADIQSLINSNFTAGLLNLQRAMQKKQTAQDIQRLGSTELQALAQAETSSAAAGTIGASVNAVAQDITLKIGEARIASYEQNDMNTFNLQTQIRNLYQGYLDSQQEIDTTVPDIPGMPPQYGAVSVSAGRAAIGAGISYAGNYLSQYMAMQSGGGGLGITASGGGLSFFGGSLNTTIGSASGLNITSSYSLK